MFLTDSYVEVLTPNVIVFGDGAFKKVCAWIDARLLQLCPILLQPQYCSPPGCLIHRYSPGKNFVTCCHFFLQGIFLTQGLKPAFLVWRELRLNEVMGGTLI